jgi:bacteriocin-like protein
MDNTFELSDKELQSITGGYYEGMQGGEVYYYSDDFSGGMIGGTQTCSQGWAYGTQSGYVQGSDPSDPSDPSPFYSSYTSPYSTWC